MPDDAQYDDYCWGLSQDSGDSEYWDMGLIGPRHFGPPPDKVRVSCRDCGKRIYLCAPNGRTPRWHPQKHDCDKSELLKLLPDLE